MTIEITPLDSTCTTEPGTMNVGDTATPLQFMLAPPVGTPSFAGSSLEFIMTEVGQTTPTVEAAATWDNTAAGQGHYAWQSADVATPGIFNLQVRVTFSGGAVLHFPNGG